MSNLIHFLVKPLILNESRLCSRLGYEKSMFSRSFFLGSEYCTVGAVVEEICSCA